MPLMTLPLSSYPVIPNLSSSNPTCLAVHIHENAHTNILTPHQDVRTATKTVKQHWFNPKPPRILADGNHAYIISISVAYFFYYMFICYYIVSRYHISQKQLTEKFFDNCLRHFLANSTYAVNTQYTISCSRKNKDPIQQMPPIKLKEHDFRKIFIPLDKVIQPS